MACGKPFKEAETERCPAQPPPSEPENRRARAEAVICQVLLLTVTFFPNWSANYFIRSKMVIA